MTTLLHISDSSTKRLLHHTNIKEMRQSLESGVQEQRNLERGQKKGPWGINWFRFKWSLQCFVAIQGVRTKREGTKRNSSYVTGRLRRFAGWSESELMLNFSHEKAPLAGHRLFFSSDFYTILIKESSRWPPGLIWMISEYGNRSLVS